MKSYAVRDLSVLVFLGLFFTAICTVTLVSQLDVSEDALALQQLVSDNATFEEARDIGYLRAYHAQAWWAMVAAILSGIGSLVTAGGLVFVAAQLREQRRATELTLANQRAYVDYFGIKSLSYAKDGINTDQWGIFLRWTNTGQTQARKVGYWVRMDWLDQGSVPDMTTPTDIIARGGRISPSALVETPVVRLTPTEINASVAGPKSFFIWGGAVYEDVFNAGVDRTVTFCVQLAGYDGNPELYWDAVSNPVNLHFANVGLAHAD